MAAALTLLSASPFCLRYQYAHDGAGSGTVERTQAQMLADLAGVTGPLRAFLAKTYSNLAWAARKNDPAVSLYSTTQSVAAGTAVSAVFGLQGGATNALVCAGPNANGGSATIEVRFNHTVNR